MVLCPPEILHFPRPGKDGAGSRVVQGRETLRRGEDDIPVFLFPCEPVAVPVAAEYYEAEVVVVCRYFAYEFQRFRVSFRGFQYPLVGGVLVVEPEYARPEAFCPQFLADGAEIPYGVAGRDVAR